MAEVRVGETCSLARKSDGSCWAWGYNGYGTLGIGANSLGLPVPVPTQVVGMTEGVTAISAGEDHAAALRSGGVLRSWGANYWGQTGNSATPYVPSLPPTIVNEIGPCPILSAASITHATLAGGVPITITGANFYPGASITLGGLPLGNSVVVSEQTITGLTPPLPALVTYGIDVAIAAGAASLPSSIIADHAVLKSDGTLWGWGDNPQGGLGFYPPPGA